VGVEKGKVHFQLSAEEQSAGQFGLTLKRT